MRRYSEGPRKLNVLYSFSLRFGLPGIGTTAWYQIHELVKRGIQVTLFCGSYERAVPGIHRVVETMRFAGIPLPYRLVGNERAFRFHDGKVAREVTRQAGRSGGGSYDVIHCWPLGSVATLRAAKAAGAATVLERPNAHTAFAYEVVAREHKKLGVPIVAGYSHAPNPERLRIEEAEYHSATLLACPSDFVAGTFLARGADPAKIGRHQYGYDPAKFSPGAERPSDRPFTMVFVGRCEPRKGLHYALEAWHRSGAPAHGRFVICGTYVPGYRKVLTAWLDGASVEERGYLADVSGEMRNADVLVLPSIEEGSALVTYEARASGCVLLVSEAAGAKLQDGRHGFVHRVGDVDQLASQLQELISDPGLMQRMRSASIAELDGLTWSAAADLQCGLYKRAMRIASRRKNASGGA